MFLHVVSLIFLLPDDIKFIVLYKRTLKFIWLIVGSAVSKVSLISKLVLLPIAPPPHWSVMGHSEWSIFENLVIDTRKESEISNSIRILQNLLPKRRNSEDRKRAWVRLTHIHTLPLQVLCKTIF